MAGGYHRIRQLTSHLTPSFSSSDEQEPSQTQTQNVLTYYGLERNPFSHLMASAHYIDPDYTPPVWFDVNDYSTSRVIFGKRGTGKTSLRLYFKNHLKKNHPKAFVVDCSGIAEWGDSAKNFLYNTHDPKNPVHERAQFENCWRINEFIDTLLVFSVKELTNFIITNYQDKKLPQHFTSAISTQILLYALIYTNDLQNFIQLQKILYPSSFGFPNFFNKRNDPNWRKEITVVDQQNNLLYEHYLKIGSSNLDTILKSITSSPPQNRFIAFQQIITKMDRQLVILLDSLDEIKCFADHPGIISHLASVACVDGLLALGGIFLFWPGTRKKLGLDSQQAHEKARFDRNLPYELRYSFDDMLSMMKIKFERNRTKKTDHTFEDIFTNVGPLKETELFTMKTPREMTHFFSILLSKRLKEHNEFKAEKSDIDVCAHEVKK